MCEKQIPFIYNGKLIYKGLIWF